MSVPGASITAVRMPCAGILAQAISVNATSDMKEMDSTAPVGPCCSLLNYGMRKLCIPCVAAVYWYNVLVPFVQYGSPVVALEQIEPGSPEEGNSEI